MIAQIQQLPTLSETTIEMMWCVVRNNVDLRTMCLCLAYHLHFMSSSFSEHSFTSLWVAWSVSDMITWVNHLDTYQRYLLVNQYSAEHTSIRGPGQSTEQPKVAGLPAARPGWERCKAKTETQQIQQDTNNFCDIRKYTIQTYTNTLQVQHYCSNIKIAKRQLGEIIVQCHRAATPVSFKTPLSHTHNKKMYKYVYNV